MRMMRGEKEISTGRTGLRRLMRLSAFATAAAAAIALSCCGDRDVMDEPASADPVFGAPVLDPLQTPTNAAQISVGGTAEPGAAVEIIGTVQASGTADGAGRFSIGLTLSTAPASETPNHLAVRYSIGSDFSGWAVANVLHDPVPPAAPALNALTSPTNQQIAALSGLTEPNCRIAVSGALLPASTRADASGVFSVQVALQPQQSNVLSAVSTDEAGNRSAAATLAVYHDSVPPKQAETGLLRAYAAGGTVRISGGYMCVEPSAVVTVLNSYTLGTASVAAGANGTFSAAIPGGAFGQAITVFCTDAAQNRSASPDPSVTVSQAWSEIADAGAPAARCGATLTSDMRNNRMVMFGGRDASGARTDSCWSLDLTAGSEAWTQITASGPPAARYGHSAVYDPMNRRVVVFGGEDGSGYYNDVWALDVSAPGSESWVQVTPLGTPPAARAWHTAVLNPWSGGMVVFGGRDAATVYNDVYDCQLFSTVSPNWMQGFPQGTPPDARWGHGACVDVNGVRMLVFGGINQGGGYTQALFALILTGGGAWSALTSTGAPSARAFHAVFEDNIDSRMIVFGGDAGTQRLADSFSFDMASGTWSALALSDELARPTGRERPCAAFDLTSLKGVLFGGAADSVPSSVYGDLWQLR